MSVHVLSAAFTVEVRCSGCRSNPCTGGGAYCPDFPRFVEFHACSDPEHRGLDRLVREFPAIVPGDTSWAGPGVEVLYLEKQRLLEENRALRLGRAEHRSNLRASVCIGFACGVAFLYALAVLLGGRPW
jgi:hypothetical protein